MGGGKFASETEQKKFYNRLMRIKLIEFKFN